MFELFVVLLAIAGGIGLIVGAVLIRAWTLVTMWEWFIVPVFIGAPVITMPVAIGISLIVGMFTQHLQNKVTDPKKSRSEILGDSVAHAFVGPLVTLAFGWIALQFM
jgi:predicted phage tail protein